MRQAPEQSKKEKGVPLSDPHPGSWRASGRKGSFPFFFVLTPGGLLPRVRAGAGTHCSGDGRGQAGRVTPICI